jgi:hypothetical protein
MVRSVGRSAAPLPVPDTDRLLLFKIEHTFKQAVNQVGTLAYHFWMRKMKPLRRRNGNQYMHRESLDYRNAVKRKLRAYHVFIQAGLIAQGLLQISPQPSRSSSAIPSALGFVPFDPASRPPNWSLQLRCASACRNFSWITQNALSSRNSSSTAKTKIKSSYSAWPHDPNSGLMRT